MLVSVDVETTGRVAGYHEIVQIAVVPLTSEIVPVPDVTPFYMDVAPERPERFEPEARMVNGLDLQYLLNNCPDPWQAADLFDDWFTNLKLPLGKRLVPLAHNWAFERGFLIHWLGIESFGQFFDPHPRDAMLFALSINDAAVYHGKPIPFNYVRLGYLCQVYGIEVEDAHDALCDALCEAKLYRAMLASFGS